ncbi:MAG TPA: saccharopine dehydrogenase C-terminal domain-containing protein [Puia sp.]|nr:saccharopine dehydrogenase C-terminal domain-containing protein [Puia sp.]
MRNILLFGAGKSAISLIEYLTDESRKQGWHLTIGANDLTIIRSKTREVEWVTMVAIDIQDEIPRRDLISKSDIVISLLPPSFHRLVAVDCLHYRKNLLTASYVDEYIRALSGEVSKYGLIFLCEIGLDPGIDHMSVMSLVTRIRSQEGKVTSFKSHTGGLVAPESDNNPWRYKISWNPRNVVLAGSTGATFRENGKTRKIEYRQLFEECRPVYIDGLGELNYYPNRNSLEYMPLYGLEDVDTFIRTTLRYPEFCQLWKCVVAAKLADDTFLKDPNSLTFKTWSAAIMRFIDNRNIEAYEFLGLFSDKRLPASAKTSADVLQYLMERKLAMEPTDKDMIVMLHEVEYSANNEKCSVQSSLVVKGKDSSHTAMAKTVGLPLGIAAKLVLMEKFKLPGVRIPVEPEIYRPVLKELEEHDIIFKESTHRISAGSLE